MANQGFPNAAGGGVQTSSTARTSGEGTILPDTAFIKGERIADPGMHNDLMDSPSDQFGANGQLSTNADG